MPSQPQQPKVGPRLSLLQAVTELAEGSQKPTARHRLVYQVSGGPPGKRLEQTLEISGTGAVSLKTRDQLVRKAERRARAKVPRQQIQNVFRELVDSRLFENLDTGGGFMPDSMIGSIRFEDGTQKVSYYFLADEEQRQQQRKGLNPSLQRMTSVLDAMVQGLSGEGGGNQSK